MIVSNSELKEKLDTAQESKLIRWLNERQIEWDRDAKGHVFTTLSAIERHLFKESGEEVDF